MNNLPKGWEWKKLGDVCEINPSKREIIDVLLSDKQEVSFVPMASVSEKGKIVSEETRLLKDVIKGFTYFVKGDILIAKITPCFENGKRALVKRIQHKIGFGTTEFHVLRPKKEVISEWIYYIISSQKFRNFGKRNMTGTAGQKRIPKKFIENYEIPVPTLPVQKRIVAILERAERLKEIRQQANDETNTIIQSLFYDMFRYETCYENSWDQKNLGDVCLFVRGPFGGSLKKDIFQSQGYAVYEQQHAISDNFTYIRYFITEEKFNEMKRFELNSGDLIMSCSGTMGKIAIVPPGIRKGIINQALLKLTPKKNLSHVFLKHWLESKSFQNSLKVFSQGAAIQNVASVKILKDIKIPLPPMNIQNQFAAIIEKIESLKQKQSNSTSDINTLFDALMQKAFNGELVGERVTRK